MDVDLAPEPAEFGLSMSVSAIRSGDIVELVGEIDKASDELAEQLVKMFFSTMDKVVEGTGNVVDAGGELTFEKVYELLDKIEWGLDDQDELSLPTLILHPDAVRRLPELTTDEQAQIEALKKRKHEELLARRRSRRLS